MDNDIERRRVDSRRKKIYRQHRQDVGEGLIRAVLRMLATVDASKRVNELLSTRYRLDGVQVDVNEIETVARNVLRSEVAALLVRYGHIPEEHKQEFLDRFLSRLIPSRDGTPEHPLRLPPRVEELESMVARETRRIGLPSKIKPEGEVAFKKLRQKVERIERRR